MRYGVKAIVIVNQSVVFTVETKWKLTETDIFLWYIGFYLREVVHFFMDHFVKICVPKVNNI